MNTLAYLCVVLLTETAFGLGLFDNGCQYGLRDAADRCIQANRDLENKMNHMEAMQEQNVERVNAITKEYGREFTTLVNDAKTLKTVTNRLVEDSVKTEGKLRVLQDVGLEVRGMHNQMETDKNKLTEMIGDVKGKLEKQAAAQTMVTAKMSTQMRDNNEILTGLQSKVMYLEDKLGKLGPSQTSDSNPSNMQELEGQLTALQSKLDRNLEFYQGQISAIITAVQQIQQKMEIAK